MDNELKITNTDSTLSVQEQSVLDVLRENRVNIRSSCGGHATCMDCVVRVKAGEENFTEVNFDEKKLLGNVYYITKERLACQLHFKNENGLTKQSATIEIMNLDS